MARPKKEKDISHPHHITLRLSEIEYELVMDRVKESGLSRSEYLRRQIINGSFEIRYEIVADMPELERIGSELGKIGTNLNQIAKYFHMGGVRSKAMQDEIHDGIQQIFEMRNEIKMLTGNAYGSIKTSRK